jgi:hypothetical protein
MTNLVMYTLVWNPPDVKAGMTTLKGLPLGTTERGLPPV